MPKLAVGGTRRQGGVRGAQIFAFEREDAIYDALASVHLLNVLYKIA